MKIIGIYKITCVKTKKVYIGQSVNIERRFKTYKNLRCKDQPKLYYSFKKYGIDKHKFEILTSCDISELSYLERYYQELYDSVDNGLNCVYVDETNGTFLHTEETKRKISEAHKGKIVSEETRERLRKVNLGKKLSEETKEKIKNSSHSEANLKRHSELSEKLKGRKQSKQHIEKRASKHRGQKRSDEAKLNMSKNSKGKNSGISNASARHCVITNLETLKTYEGCMKDVAKLLNCDVELVWHRLIGKTKLGVKFREYDFKYKNEKSNDNIEQYLNIETGIYYHYKSEVYEYCEKYLGYNSNIVYKHFKGNSLKKDIPFIVV